MVCWPERLSTRQQDVLKSLFDRGFGQIQGLATSGQLDEEIDEIIDTLDAYAIVLGRVYLVAMANPLLIDTIRICRYRQQWLDATPDDQRRIEMGLI